MVHILVPLAVARLLLLLLILQHSHHMARLWLGAAVHLVRLRLGLLVLLVLLLLLLVMMLLVLMLLVLLLVLRLLLLLVRLLQVVVHRLDIELVVAERGRVKRLVHVLVEHVDIELTAATSTARCRVVARFHDFSRPLVLVLRWLVVVRGKKWEAFAPRGFLLLFVFGCFSHPLDSWVY